MATERLQIPDRRLPLWDNLRHNQTFVGVLSLFSSMTHKPPRQDTSIAWEDGEAKDRPQSESER